MYMSMLQHHWFPVDLLKIMCTQKNYQKECTIRLLSLKTLLISDDKLDKPLKTPCFVLLAIN